MPDVGLPELVVILFVVLLVFGPGRLPEAGAAVGRAMREFRDAVQGLGAVENERETAPDEKRGR